MTEKLEKICRNSLALNPQNYLFPEIAVEMNKTGRINEDEAIKRIKLFYEDARLVYKDKIDSFAEDSPLMQRVLEEKTTYEKETERFREVFEPSFIQRLKNVVRKPYYDKQSFDNLTKDIKNLADLMNFGTYCCHHCYSTPDSSISGFRKVAGTGIIASIPSLFLTADKYPPVITILGLEAVIVITMDYFIGPYNRFSTLISDAKRVDSYLGLLYFRGGSK